MPSWHGLVVAVHVASRIGAAGPVDDTPKRARRADGVTLFAVLEVRSGAGTRFYSDAGAPVELGGRRHPVRPVREAPPVDFFWFKVEPTVESLSNTASGAFRYEEIPYAETAMMAAHGKSAIQADVRPTRTTDRGHGIGTMRFKVVAVSGDRAVASPGSEARRRERSGGLDDTVARVSLRRDDTYLGYLTELYGQPYIWASAGASSASHQTERLEGADCADFVIYGQRRLGRDLAYSWTGALPKVTRLLAAGRAGKDGVYIDQAGRALAFPRAGDLVLFPRHVGVLTEDRGRPGVLDLDDVMVHAYFATPRAQPLRETDYAAAPVEVRRWR
jgi:hypothetical protein